jgi:hypothetical protein
MTTTQLTQARLQDLVKYDRDTGIFTWNMTRRRCRSGDKAGCSMQNGYAGIRLDDTLYTAHRLAWLYVHGEWPARQLDHVNGVRADNRLCNLREATNAQNAQNRKRVDNKSGFPGVRKENSKWLAEIKVDYKPIRLGLFTTPEAAHDVYLKAKQELHPFSRHQ